MFQRKPHRQRPASQPAVSTRRRPALRRAFLLGGLLVIALAAFAGAPVRGDAAGPSRGRAGGLPIFGQTPSGTPVHGQTPSGGSVPGQAPSATVAAVPGPRTLPTGSAVRSTATKSRTSIPRSAAAATTRAPSAGQVRSVPLHHPYASPQVAAAHAAAATRLPNAPLATSSIVESSQENNPSILNFGAKAQQVFSHDGVNSVDSGNANGFAVEPPDQGLCVSNAFEMELVNDAGAIYSSRGASIGQPFDLNSFFGENPFEFMTDPRCYYDASAQAWFATSLALGFDQSGLNVIESHVDIAVNPTSDPTTAWTVYFFNTTAPNGPNCPCFGDQPLLGVDAQAVYIGTNEFPGAQGANSFNGEQLYMLSKWQMIQGAQSPALIQYTGFSFDGSLLASLQPAATPGPSPAEYFLGAFDPTGTTDTTLFVYAMTNEQAITNPLEMPVLSGIAISGQTYGVPPNADQGGSTGFQLQTDDDRMQQVQNLNGTLYGSLDTVVQIPGDSENRSGAAWYQIVPRLGMSDGQSVVTGASIAGQGIVAVKGNYLLYPAIAVVGGRAPVMVMTLSGSGIYPSAVWSAAPFSTYVLAGRGAGADQGFTCSPPYSGGQCRWGDYSAAVVIPGEPFIWLGTEYISGAALRDVNGNVITNWATRLTEVFSK